MTDIFKRLRENPGPLGQFADYAEGYFVFPKLEGPIGPRMKFQGREVIFWSANDYLGLCNHPEVLEADAKAAAEYGMFYPMGARAMSGETDQHQQLERELAEFVKKESAYLLNFGYQGMVSTIDALVGRHDVIVYDADSYDYQRIFGLFMQQPQRQWRIGTYHAATHKIVTDRDVIS